MIKVYAHMIKVYAHDISNLTFLTRQKVKFNYPLLFRIPFHFLGAKLGLFLDLLRVPRTPRPKEDPIILQVLLLLVRPLATMIVVSTFFLRLLRFWYLEVLEVFSENGFKQWCEDVTIKIMYFVQN